jgi:hypothetical protein
MRNVAWDWIGGAVKASSTGWVLITGFDLHTRSMDDAETRVNTNDYSFVTDIYTNLKQLQWRRLRCMQLWPTKYVGHFAADGVFGFRGCRAVPVRVR